MDTAEILEYAGYHIAPGPTDYELEIYAHGNYILTLSRGERTHPWKIVHMQRTVTNDTVLYWVNKIAIQRGYT